MTDTTDRRDRIAAALCDAVYNWPMWDSSSVDTRMAWRHCAARLTSYLAERGLIVKEVGDE